MRQVECPPNNHVFENGAKLEFDIDAVKGWDTGQIRARYPRLRCIKCGSICYASFAHYVMGDY